MSHQVATVVRTCVGMLRLLRKLAPLLSFTALCTVVSALIISRLDYGNALYVGLPDKLLNRLQVVMNNAARFVFGLPRRAHVTPLLQQLHWLPIKQRARFKGLCIAHKAIHGQAPTYIKVCLENYRPGRTLRSSEAGQLVCPRFLTTSMGGRAFSSLIPQCLNKMPVELHKEAALLPFRKKLKTFLYTEAWGTR